MKHLCFTAFVVFWSIVGTITALNLLAGDTAAPAAAETFTLEEVARHHTADDCWMAIEGVVYDVSDYVDQHPAPPAVIVAWCGIDATRGMHTKGYGRDHSHAAWTALERFRIGTLAPAAP